LLAEALGAKETHVTTIRRGRTVPAAVDTKQEVAR
jgi:hypothetical protein